MNLKNAIEQDFSKDWKSVIAAQNDKNKDRAYPPPLRKNKRLYF